MASADGNDDKPSVSGTFSEMLNSSKMDEILEGMIGYFQNFGFHRGESDSKSKEKVLDEPTLDGIVKYIQDQKCKNIITMAGAGISTSAGIPDFRSPGSGLYHNLEKYKLPDPQAIFEIDFFLENPQPFFALAKELYPGSFKPTISHYFLRMLHDKGLLLRHYTQNIDTLERVAGIPGEKLVEAHGTFHTSHCLKCKKEYSLEWMKERIFADAVPTCEDCNGVVKPDIVFFGESLPARFSQKVSEDFSKCDLLIILGSSLIVQPFASIIDRVKPTCPRLLINREKTGQRDRVMQLMGMGAGMDFDSSENTRDVAWIGDCDNGCQVMAKKLGWEDELLKLVEEEHAKIDAENPKSKDSDEKGSNL
ncbi:NAD-dependent protein deacetylase sirtuin-2 [Ischnura elegans]|uniref:NAD-dependent protein deacetylase sirtuin-2 n=1 Tax=Ischnura elegans TaxID=197161 RepID=UPI001ED89A66|nr:NAD-dependent protein deacetylase sirtuin-2 [Ischnura elegans]